MNLKKVADIFRAATTAQADWLNDKQGSLPVNTVALRSIHWVVTPKVTTAGPELSLSRIHNHAQSLAVPRIPHWRYTKHKSGSSLYLYLEL